MPRSKKCESLDSVFDLRMFFLSVFWKPEDADSMSQVKYS